MLDSPRQAQQQGSQLECSHRSLSMPDSLAERHDVDAGRVGLQVHPRELDRCQHSAAHRQAQLRSRTFTISQLHSGGRMAGCSNISQVVVPLDNGHHVHTTMRLGAEVQRL